MLYPPFLPSIALFFTREIKYSEKLIIKHKFLLKIVHTCLHLTYTNNTVVQKTRVHLYPKGLYTEMRMEKLNW